MGAVLPPSQMVLYSLVGEHKWFGKVRRHPWVHGQIWMGLSSDELGTGVVVWKWRSTCISQPSDGLLSSHLSFQGLKYWGQIQVLVTTRRLITPNNWPLRRSTLGVSSRCWPRRDHPMLMSAPGSYYCPLPTRAYLQYNFKAIPSWYYQPIHPKSEKVSGPKRLQKSWQPNSVPKQCKS